MSVYILAKIDITDRQVYAKYEEGFMAIFKRYGGRLLSVDEDPTVLEGTWPETRTVMAEFKDKESAMKWYQSPEYQELLQHRLQASSADIIVVQGNLEEQNGPQKI